jgi:hypothetical protein
MTLNNINLINNIDDSLIDNDIDDNNIDEILDDMIIDIFKPYILYIKLLLNENNIKKKFIIDNKKRDNKLNINVLNEILKKHLDINNK